MTNYSLQLNHRLSGLNRCGFSIPVVSSSSFKIEEDLVRDSIKSIVFVWNKGIRIARLLARGEDWNIFLKVHPCLWCSVPISSDVSKEACL